MAVSSHLVPGQEKRRMIYHDVYHGMNGATTIQQWRAVISKYARFPVPVEWEVSEQVCGRRIVLRFDSCNLTPYRVTVRSILLPSHTNTRKRLVLGLETEVFKGNFMQANVNRHKMYSPELREQPLIRESFLHVCFIIWQRHAAHSACTAAVVIKHAMGYGVVVLLSSHLIHFILCTCLSMAVLLGSRTRTVQPACRDVLCQSYFLIKQTLIIRPILGSRVMITTNGQNYRYGVRHCMWRYENFMHTD